MMAIKDVEKKEKQPKEKSKKKHKKVRELKKREALMGYIFTAPWLIGAVVLMLYPLVMSFWYSACNVRFTARGNSIRFNDFQNYADVIRKDTMFFTNLTEYFSKMIIAVPVIVVFALLISMLLNTKIKGRGIYRTIFFLPVIVVSGPVMGMLNAEGASALSVIDTVAISTMLQNMLPTGLANAIINVFSQIIMILWYAGVQILIFIAVIQKIDTSLYEAAKIDGGSQWECFWKITLPTIKPMILINAIYTLVFLSNDTIFNSIITAIKDAMVDPTERGYGYASAMAWMYSLIVILLVLIILLLFKERKDPYQKQVAKVKKFEKRTRRNLAKAKRHMEKNNKKFEKHVEKQAQGKIKVKGGHDSDE